MPALQTYLSERTDDSHQGELQGILASMGSLALIVSRGLWLQQLWLATFLDNSPVFLPVLPLHIKLLFCIVACSCLRQRS